MKRGTCQNISIADAKSLIETSKVVIIDVRDRDEYIKSNLRNSINIPVVNIKRDIRKFVNNRNERIIVYCSTGERSAAACQILAEKGYRNVYNVSTGINFN